MIPCPCHLERITPKEPIDPEALQAFLETVRNTPQSQEWIFVDAEPSWTILHAPCEDCERAGGVEYV